MNDSKGYARKVRTNITIDKELKREFKKLVPNLSYWVEEQMKEYIAKNKKQ